MIPMNVHTVPKPKEIIEPVLMAYRLSGLDIGEYTYTTNYVTILVHIRGYYSVGVHIDLLFGFACVNRYDGKRVLFEGSIPERLSKALDYCRDYY